MKALLFGASGMVGSGVLHECIDDERVESVLVIGRSPCGLTNPKLREIIRDDFFAYADIAADLAGTDACFFCLGVSSAGMSEADYQHLTFDLTVAAAEAVLAASPGVTFCYVSGQGTDSTEKGRFMWARVKGRTENHLLAMPFRQAFMFRPGFIQPMRGVRSKTKLYQALYNVSGPVLPLLRRFAPNAVTTTENMGRAMIEVALHGSSKRVLETRDINRLAVSG
jgi:uncharacterized protein YbjT (DUF2867 family)